MFRKTYFNFEKIPAHLRLSEEKVKRIVKRKIKELRKYFKRSGFKKAVIGVSGGVDSTLSATLIVKVLGPKNVYFLRIPCLGVSSKEGLVLAERLAKNLKLEKGI